MTKLQLLGPFALVLACCAVLADCHGYTPPAALQPLDTLVESVPSAGGTLQLPPPDVGTLTITSNDAPAGTTVTIVGSLTAPAGLGTPQPSIGTSAIVLGSAGSPGGNYCGKGSGLVSFDYDLFTSSSSWTEKHPSTWWFYDYIVDPSTGFAYYVDFSPPSTVYLIEYDKPNGKSWGVLGLWVGKSHYNGTSVTFGLPALTFTKGDMYVFNGFICVPQPPTPTPAPTAGPVVLAPSSLSLTGLGASNAQTVGVSESGYTGTFTATSGTCTGIADVASSSGNSFTVTPIAVGQCTLNFSNAAGQSASLPVVVTTTIITGG